MFGRDIERAKCSCGGEVSEVDQSPEEEDLYNCMRGCCGVTLACNKCGTRFAVKVGAPDVDW